MHWAGLVFFFIISLSPSVGLADDFCSNQETISFVINRPTNAISPCAVAYKNVLIEGGIQHRTFPGAQSIDLYPNIELRLGLPEKSEIYFYPPTYIASHAPPYPDGNSTVAVGGKHQMWGKKNFVFTLDGFIVPPGGSRDYGMQAMSEHVNAIIEYLINDTFTVTFMLSYLHLSQPASEPNETYSAISPNLVLAYNFSPKMSVFSEVYGQSRTSPDSTRGGYNFDGGFIFLITNNITFDVEFSSRINGELGQYNNYVGAGGVIRL